LPPAVSATALALVVAGYDTCIYDTTGSWIGPAALHFLLLPINFAVLGGASVWLVHTASRHNRRAGPATHRTAVRVARVAALSALPILLAVAAIVLEASLTYHTASPEALSRCGGGTPPWWPGW